MKKFLGVLGVAGVLVLGCNEVALADTPVSGVISTDTTWNLAGSPYIVTGNVYVQGAATPTLTINPNVEVRFAQNQSLFIGDNSS
ncbi:MAG: hypothetical protein AAB267_01110, partial [Candidatus Desantisbacteria bacterium]